MYRKIQTIVPFLLLFILVGCSTPSEDTAISPGGIKAPVSVEEAEDVAEEVRALEDGPYIVNIEESVLKWLGRTLVKSHDGVIQIQSGSAEVEGGMLVAGEAVIDMTTIETKDIEGPGAKGLDDHLKNEDFFDVVQYPTASIVMKRIDDVEGEKQMVADLTIKGITNEVVFPIAYEEIDDSIILTADIDIDRIQWGVEYNSGSVFKELGDRAINDIMELDLSLVLDQQN